jgi:hypothetical protein
MTAAPACENLRNDHRAIEEHLDTLLAALLRLTPELIPEIQATVRGLQDLAIARVFWSNAPFPRTLARR